jgi:hypothetical protein
MPSRDRLEFCQSIRFIPIKSLEFISIYGILGLQ